jgi:hypothetical protein
MSLEAVDAAAIGPWGTDVAGLVSWLARPDPAGPAFVPEPTPGLDNVPGFVASPWINLACAAFGHCLRGAGRRTGLVLASVLGDTETADRASTAVARGRFPQPLLFYQSVPSAVFGRITADHVVDGPLVCVAGGPRLAADAVEAAELMLATDDVEFVVLCYLDAGGGRWRRAAAAALTGCWGEPVIPDWDCAVAVRLQTSSAAHAAPPPDVATALPRPLRDVVGLALSVPVPGNLTGRSTR